MRRTSAIFLAAALFATTALGALRPRSSGAPVPGACFGSYLCTQNFNRPPIATSYDALSAYALTCTYAAMTCEFDADTGAAAAGNPYNPAHPCPAPMQYTTYQCQDTDVNGNALTAQWINADWFYCVYTVTPATGAAITCDYTTDTAQLFTNSPAAAAGCPPAPITCGSATTSPVRRFKGEDNFTASRRRLAARAAAVGDSGRGMQTQRLSRKRPFARQA